MWLRTIIKFSASIVLLLSSLNVYSDIASLLQKGIAVTNENLDELATTSWEYAISSDSQLLHDAGFADAFILVEGSDQLFSLGEGSIFLTNFKQRSYVGHWPLTRWQHEPIIDQQSHYYPAPETVTLDRIEGLIDERYGLELDEEKKPKSVGCLNQTPLRYGDLEGDGINEIVLNFGVFNYKHDWVIFSPEFESISFSMRYALQDQIDVDFGSYQWIQQTRQRNTDPGIRTYAKAFLGDFDQDDNPDILVWRKRYESNKNDNPVVGYHLVKQVVQHFERDLETQAASDNGVTGEYLPQETEQSQIQAWLASNNHSWQTGYPSQSECAGQEELLIPEMHDPLLNDPDVLQ